MAGFITHYLFGMESIDKMADNYIHSVIKENTHAFLIGLQGTDLLTFNPHSMSRHGLSYHTASMSLRNQEYAAFFNNMADYVCTQSNEDRDTCIAYMAGFLCFYAIDEAASPYIMYRVWQDLPVKCGAGHVGVHRREVETIIDAILLRSHCHMEPSQLNFEALTFVNRREQNVIAQLLRHTMLQTYKCRISTSQIIKGIHILRRRNIYLQPNSKIRRLWCNTIEKNLPLLPTAKRKIYEDYLTDESDYMNESKKAWYAYPGCLDATYLSFNEIFANTLHSSLDLLENLDSCLSWGMDREKLINAIITLSPYNEM